MSSANKFAGGIIGTDDEDDESARSDALVVSLSFEGALVSNIGALGTSLSPTEAKPDNFMLIVAP